MFLFETWHYLTPASAPVVPPDYILIVFILLGQVIEEHALRNRLKCKSNVKLNFSNHFLKSLGHRDRKEKLSVTFLSRKEAIRPKFFGCWMNLKWWRIKSAVEWHQKIATKLQYMKDNTCPKQKRKIIIIMHNDKLLKQKQKHST